MKMLVAILLIATTAETQSKGAVPAYVGPTVVDAPSATKRKQVVITEQKTGFWAGESPGGSDMPLRTNRQVWTTKSFRVAHGAYLGAIVYDVELTHEGLAHHRCVEKGDNPFPTRGSLYLKAAPEYGASLLFGWLVSRYVWQPLVFDMPAVGSVVHIRGGSRWLTNCW